MSRARTAHALALLGALVACGAEAAAAPCCMSAGAVGMGRLKVWEDLAVGLQSSWVGGLGYWDPAGQWQPYVSYGELDWRNELWAQVRISRRLAATVSVPWLVSYRRAGTLGDGVGAGLGDARLGVRYDLLEVGEYAWIPAVAIIAGVLTPTGRSVSAAGTPIAADVGGRGAWAVHAGLVLEKTYLPWYVRLSGDVEVPFERWQDGAALRFGPAVNAGLTGGVEVAQGWVVSLLTRARWEANIVRDGVALENSSGLELGLGAALAWEVSPHWTLQAAADSGVFVDGVGFNRTGRVTATLGARYGYF